MADDDRVNGVFGPRVSASDDASRRAWWCAYDQLVHFRGDPVATLDPVNEADPAFVMGPVFTLTYRLLGGVHPGDPAVALDLARLHRRSARGDAREQRHVAAALLLHEGAFQQAAAAWDAITLDHPDDFPAVRFVHDVCLHIGDDSVRLPSAERAAAAWPVGTREHGLTQGLLSFALEEVARYDEAVEHGRIALDADPDDLWARHALAHVFESTDRHDDAIELLVPSTPRWQEQTLLSNHVWWHLGLRLLAQGDLASTLAVFDDHLLSTTAFGLADATALLWRIDLASAHTVDTAARWAVLADRWATYEQRHTCGFLDMHTAFAFAAAADHPAAESFWAGVTRSHSTGGSYNDITFRETVVPLVAGIRALGELDRDRGSRLLRSVLPTLRRVGGSVVQRDIVARTLAAADTAA